MSVGNAYTNRKQAKVFIKYIAEAERSKSREAFSHAQFVSLLSDSSTDSAVIEEEILYARYAVKGEVTVQYCSLEPVDKADAVHITAAIERGASKVFPTLSHLSAFLFIIAMCSCNNTLAIINMYIVILVYGDTKWTTMVTVPVHYKYWLKYM